MAKVTLSVENGNVADILSQMFGRQEVMAKDGPANAATVSFGTLSTSVEVEAGDTVARLFAKGANDLGMEAGRALTFQNADGRVIPANSPAEVGAAYLAAPNHDPKG